MLFYVPPLLPVMSQRGEDGVKTVSEDLFHEFDRARAPMAYLANLLGAGNEAPVRYALKKQMAVRWKRRLDTVGDVDPATVERALREADCTPEQADEIYRLTALCTFEDRFVIPPSHREEALEMLKDPQEWRQEAGFGFRSAPARGL
jgi:nitrate reductase beta subunit